MEKVFGKWRVVIVKKGDKYGLENCLTYNEDEPAVEFFDMSSNKEQFEHGYFVARYYISTLLLHERGMGLALYGSHAAWTVYAEIIDEIIDWLEETNQG